jgi:hypothetical protein
VLKAENPHESDSFVMNAHAARKSPTARACPFLRLFMSLLTIFCGGFLEDFLWLYFLRWLFRQLC